MLTKSCAHRGWCTRSYCNSDVSANTCCLECVLCIQVAAERNEIKKRGIIHIHMRSIALISTTALTENRIAVRRNIFHLIVATSPRMHIEFYDYKKCVRTYNEPDSMSFHCTFCATNFVHFIFRSHSSLFFPYFSDHNNNSVMNSVQVSLFSVMPDAYC